MNTQTMISGRRRQSPISKPRYNNVDDHQHNNTISDDNEDDPKAAAASAVADPSNTYNNSAPAQPYIHHADDDDQLMIMNPDYSYNNMRHAVEVELEAGGVQIVNRALFLRSYQFSRKQTLPQRMKASLQRIKSMASTFAAYNNNSHPHHIVPPKLKPPKLMLIKNMITSHVHHS